MSPLVSVIVPLYNASPYITEALDSVLQSTYRPIEVVVMDDGSTDDSLRVAQAYAERHPEVRVLSQANAGVSAARNHAIREARGTYILPVDADDRISPDYIAHAVEAMRDDIRVVGCRAEFFGAREGEWRLPAFSHALLARKNMIPITSLFRKADWQQVGGFCEEEVYREDWLFWISLMELGGTYLRLDEIGLYYRVLPVSRRKKAKSQKRVIVDAANRLHPAYMEKYLGGPLHYHRSWSRFLNRLRSVKQVGTFDRWTEGQVIDARRNILRVTEGVVVKQFRTPCLWRGIWYGWFGKSKARRSYEYALRMEGLTPAPIAYREVRVCGVLRESWYACRQSECPHTFIELIEHPDFPNREHILRAIGRFTAELHRRGIWHPDYSQGNILFNDDASHIEVIDLNRIRWRRHVHGYPFSRLERIGKEGLQCLIEGYENV
ncbi:MAG: glycosyltransferase [Paludibacteraceae bacterium]|nr:glycosyltransferase [Paludibacteraceae bacterium]